MTRDKMSSYKLLVNTTAAKVRFANRIWPAKQVFAARNLSGDLL